MQPRTPLFVSLLPAGCQLRPYYSAESDVVDDDDNQEDEVSVDIGDVPSWGCFVTSVCTGSGDRAFSSSASQRMLNLKICAKSA